jgi:NitT/TauT family transport system substrate-binding protein
MTKVVLAIMAPTVNLANYLFGVDRGYFKAEGLDVEVIVRPGARNTEAVLKGEADFGVANECVIQEALRGPTELRILLQVLIDPLHSVLVQKDIQSLADLKGRNIAVPAAGSTPEIQTRRFLKDHGLEPGRDITVVPQPPADTMADRIGRFVSGEYSALIASPPTPFALQAKGYQAIAELSDAFPECASHGLVATQKTIAERPDVVKAMVRAYTKGVTELKTNRSAALEFIEKRFNMDSDTAARCWELMRSRWTASLSWDALKRETAFHAQNAGVVPVAPESFTDPRFAPTA